MRSVTGVRPRSLYCVLEEYHRDMEVARDAARGRFTHAGVTVDLGAEPDWRDARLPEDEEWRIEWSKFYYGLDLAHAYQETRDPIFGDAWKRLVDSWIDQVPVGFDSSDVTGRRIQNWIYAWERFARDAEFDIDAKGFGERIATSVAHQMCWLRDHLSSERNHRTLELYALFVAAIALPMLDDGGQLLAFATQELHQNLLRDVLADGVHRERSTHYHMIVLRSFLGVRENARRFSLPLPRGYDERLARACEFALHIHRPDGTIPMLSDSDQGSYLDLLRLAGNMLSRPDFLWAARRGTEGCPPKQCHASFPDGGYYIQRSGWGDGARPFDQERHLVFDCGHLGDSGHGHYDVLNIDVAANGRALIIDPGRYTYFESTPNWRRWFKGTAAHNTVCIDGLDQVPYRRGKPKGRLPLARLVGRWTAPGLDVLEGRVEAPSYDAIHTRRVTFVDHDYWIVHDDLDGIGRHHYDLRFHLPPGDWCRVTTESTAQDATVLAPGLTLQIRGAARVRLEEGWVASEYGVRDPAPVVSAVRSDVPSARLVTVIRPEDNPRPCLTTRLDSRSQGDRRWTVVEHAGPAGWVRDEIFSARRVHEVVSGTVRLKAGLVWIRRNADGAVLQLRACHAFGLEDAAGKLPCVEYAESPVRWIAWDLQTGLWSSAGGHS